MGDLLAEGSVRLGYDIYGRVSGTRYRHAPWLLDAPPVNPPPAPGISRSSLAWKRRTDEDPQQPPPPRPAPPPSPTIGEQYDAARPCRGCGSVPAPRVIRC